MSTNPPPPPAWPPPPSPPPPPPSRKGEGRTVLTLTVLLLLTLVVAGGAIAFLVTREEDDDSPEVADSPAVDDGPVAGSRPSKPRGDNSSNQPPSTFVYSPSEPDYQYEVRLPRDDWSEPVESFPTGGALLRTTLRGPSGQLLIIDRTPYEVPQLGGGYETSREVPHEQFGSATEYVFRGSDFIPECADAVCVDYLINDGSGGGWGVLGGGPDLASAQEAAESVMQSIRLPG